MEGNAARHPELRKYDFARDWDTPEANIMVGAATLAAKREAVTRLGVPAELAVVAYNAGEGVVRYAYDHAKQAGSKNPELACTQREHVAYAVEMTGIWTYYMPPKKSARKNKSGTKEEAIRIKTNEILEYPTKIAGYLDEERREGLTSGKPKPAPTKSEPTTPTKPKTRESKTRERRRARVEQRPTRRRHGVGSQADPARSHHLGQRR